MLLKERAEASASARRKQFFWRSFLSEHSKALGDAFGRFFYGFYLLSADDEYLNDQDAE